MQEPGREKRNVCLPLQRKYTIFARLLVAGGAKIINAPFMCFHVNGANHWVMKKNYDGFGDCKIGLCSSSGIHLDNGAWSVRQSSCAVPLVQRHPSGMNSNLLCVESALMCVQGTLFCVEGNSAVARNCWR